jgi:hypothetical protein
MRPLSAGSEQPDSRSRPRLCRRHFECAGPTATRTQPASFSRRPTDIHATYRRDTTVPDLPHALALQCRTRNDRAFGIGVGAFLA